jgi:hypothetical protein
MLVMLVQVILLLLLVLVLVLLLLVPLLLQVCQGPCPTCPAPSGRAIICR